MNDETRKLAVMITAAIIAANDKELSDWDGKRSPRAVAAAAEAVAKAQSLVSILEGIH